MTGGRLLPALAALLAALIWGVWFPITRAAVQSDGITPADMIMLRCWAGAIVFAPFVVKHGLKMGKTGWLGTLAVTLTLAGPFSYAMGLGAGLAPAGHAAIFTPGTFPGMVFLAGLFLFKDPATPARWLGFAAVLLGVALTAWDALSSSAGLNTGYLYFHFCAWCWTIYTLVVRASGLSPAQALGITHIAAVLVWGPFWLLSGPSGLLALPASEIAFQAFYHGALNGLAAMFLYSYAIQRLGAAEAAVFAALVPSVAAISAWPIIGEALGVLDIMALASVAVGVWLINVGGSSPGGSERPEARRRQS